MSAPEKARFYWARIGDGNFEPVAVRGKKGERMAWTIGCADPFPVDEPDSAVLLYCEYEEEGGKPEPLDPPLTPAQEKRALARERRLRLLKGHGYAGFGR